MLVLPSRNLRLKTACVYLSYNQANLERHRTWFVKLSAFPGVRDGIILPLFLVRLKNLFDR